MIISASPPPRRYEIQQTNSNLPSGTTTPTLLAWAYYLFCFSIPFEMPRRTIPVEVPTLFAFVLLVIAAWKYRFAFGWIPWTLPVVLLYLYVAIASCFVQDRNHLDEMLWLAFQILLAVAMYWLSSNLLRDRITLGRAGVAFIAGCTLHAVLYLTGAGIPSDVTDGGVGIFGQDRNYATGILNLGVLACAGTFLTRKPAAKWLSSSCLLTFPMGACIISMGSRGGMLSLACASAMFALQPGNLLNYARNIGLTAGLLAAFVFAVAQNESVWQRIESTVQAGDMTGRELIFPLSADMFLEKPIAGWGLLHNKYELASRLLMADRRHVYPARDTHNVLLEVVTSAGLLGTIPFTIVIAWSAICAWRVRGGEEGILPLACVVAALVTSMSVGWIASKLAWMALAYPVAIYHKNRIQRLNEEEHSNG